VKWRADFLLIDFNRKCFLPKVTICVPKCACGTNARAKCRRKFCRFSILQLRLAVLFDGLVPCFKALSCLFYCYLFLFLFFFKVFWRYMSCSASHKICIKFKEISFPLRHVKFAMIIFLLKRNSKTYQNY